jgi:hypothetical protein
MAKCFLVEAERIKEAKKALKTKKRHMEAEIVTLIGDIVAAQTALDSTASLYAKELNTLDSLEQQHAALVAAHAAQARDIGAEGIADAESTRSQVQADIRQAEGSISKHTAALHAADSQKSTLAKDIEALQQGLVQTKGRYRCF